MDVMDGYEACEEIRRFIQSENLYNIPIFGLTGHNTKGIHDRCKMAGMDGVLVKPIKFDTLIQTLQRATNKKL